MIHAKQHRRICAITTLAVMMSAPSWAALTRDTSFDSDGIAVVDFSTALDSARDVAVQTDGKVVLAGMSRQGTGTTFDYLAVARLNTDGSLDTTFGTAGTVITLPSGTASFGGADGRAVAIQTDGKIVVTGYYNQNTGNGKKLIVVRYLTTGALDTTFGSNGIALFATADQREAQAVAIQSDGKIVLAGQSLPTGSGYVGFITRLNADGSLDTGFGTGGTFSSALPGSGFNALSILTSGAILAAGQSGDLLLTQLTSTGALDTSFDGDGVVTRNMSTYTISGITVNTDDWLEGLAILSDGKIAVAGGYRPNGLGNVFRVVVARFTANGALDTTFGAGGFATLPTGVDDKYVYDIVARANDELVIAGLSFNPIQISADGSTTATLAGSTGFQAVLNLAVQSDGKIVGAGELPISGANYQMGALRLSPTNLSSAPPADTTPDAFSFVDQTNVAVSTTITSAPITIAGIDAAASVSVTGGEYSVDCSGTFTSSAGTVTNGQTLCVRHTSSATNSTATNTVLTVGGVSDTFTSTTLASVSVDTTPDAFSFVDQSNVALSTVVVSAAITVNGINAATAVTITGGEYSVGCTGTFTSSAGTVSNGQTLCVRHTSSASNSTATNTVLTVGGVSDTFASTTVAATTTTTPTTPAPSKSGGGALHEYLLLLLAGIAWLRRAMSPR